MPDETLLCVPVFLYSMIQKRETEASVAPPLISLDFHLYHENDMRRELNPVLSLTVKRMLAYKCASVNWLYLSWG